MYSFLRLRRSLKWLNSGIFSTVIGRLAPLGCILGAALIYLFQPWNKLNISLDLNLLGFFALLGLTARFVLRQFKNETGPNPLLTGFRPGKKRKRNPFPPYRVRKIRRCITPWFWKTYRKAL